MVLIDPWQCLPISSWMVNMKFKQIKEFHDSQEIKGAYTGDDSGKSCQAGSKHR